MDLYDLKRANLNFMIFYNQSSSSAKNKKQLHRAAFVRSAALGK
nr:MAG TPA: hypothetical protein [Bacteriophage sp.]